ncbi:hypothetical protein F4803DRAFT_108176 [Xylaria telfairii]|nr:hypothetical protein F4803DRAFT_108176 [Xylaria telfairii]
MAIHPQFWPQFWVLVRNYHLLENGLLVQSPNVDLRVRSPQIIIRAISGDYMGEPRTLESATSLRNAVDETVYPYAAHGVYISGSNEDYFPLWICLQRNEPSQEGHVWVINLSSFEYLTLPISEICWVPTHEAADGKLFTVIGSPGKHGYAKETYLPTVAQELGFPEQAKFQLPASGLPGFTRLEPEKQEAFFKKQFMSIQERCKPRSRIAEWQLPWSRRENQWRQFYTTSDEDSEDPGFFKDDFSSDDESINPQLEEQQMSEDFCRCRCLYSDLGPTRLNPHPLHRHITDDDCNLGSSHRLHCIFAAHRPDHCVISSCSREQHKHCITLSTPSSLVDSVPTPIEHQGADVDATVDGTAIVAIEIDSDDDEFGARPLSDKPELPSTEPCPSDSESVPDGQDVEPWSAFAVPFSESWSMCPMVEFFPDTEGDLGWLDEPPDLVFNVDAAEHIMWNYPNISMTPEPPEIFP